MESRQADLWTAEFATFPVATIFLLLRLTSRRVRRVKLWWDDYFAVCCYVRFPIIAFTWAVVLSLWTKNGLGLHSRDVKGMSPERANLVTKKYLFSIEHLYAFILFFAKISVLTFYWRLFHVGNAKITIHVLMACSVLWLIIRTFLTTFHCYPVKAFWNHEIHNATCATESSKFFFGTVLAHVIIEIALLILPIVQIQKLQLPALQKFGIILMFMFGVLVCIAGLVIVGISVGFDDGSMDMTWDLAPVITWASVEVNLVTISACLPMTRPACLYFSNCTVFAPTHGSDSNGFDLGYCRSQTKKSIRLSALARDRTSSTHELARPELNDGESFSECEIRPFDRQRGNISTVIGPASPIASDEHVSAQASRGVIRVRNETFVLVTTARSPS